MVLLLTDDDVKRVLTMRDAMDGIEDALREHGTGQTIDMPRSRIYAPSTGDGADFWMNTMACAIPRLGVAAMRLGTPDTLANQADYPQPRSHAARSPDWASRCVGWWALFAWAAARYSKPRSAATKARAAMNSHCCA